MSAKQVSTSSSGLSSSALLVRRVPVSWFGRPGTLTLDNGRLRFANPQGETAFDHPTSELHSLAKRAGGVGFDVWHERARYRVHPLQPRLTLGDAENSVTSLAVKVATTKWCEFLVPEVTGSPPAGVNVRRPWSTVTHTLVSVGSAVGVIAAAIGIPLIFV